MDGIRVHGPNYRARAAVSKRGMDSVLGLSKTWRVVAPSQPPKSVSDDTVKFQTAQASNNTYHIKQST